MSDAIDDMPQSQAEYERFLRARAQQGGKVYATGGALGQGRKLPWPPAPGPQAKTVGQILPTGNFDPSPTLSPESEYRHPEGIFDAEVISVDYRRDAYGVGSFATHVRTEHGQLTLSLPSRFKGSVKIRVDHTDRGIHAKVARPVKGY